MENHLNDFTQNHDQDLASVINKKWEEHRQTSFSQDPAKVFTTTEPSFKATNDHLNQQIDVVDQDLSNGNINENKSEHVETSTTGNYIRLDNDVVEKLSEIVESFREQSGTSLNGSGDGEKVKRFYFYFCPELKFSLWQTETEEDQSDESEEYHFIQDSNETIEEEEKGLNK